MKAKMICPIFVSFFPSPDFQSCKKKKKDEHFSSATDSHSPSFCRKTPPQPPTLPPPCSQVQPTPTTVNMTMTANATMTTTMTRTRTTSATTTKITMKTTTLNMTTTERMHNHDHKQNPNRPTMPTTKIVNNRTM